MPSCSSGTKSPSTSAPAISSRSSGLSAATMCRNCSGCKACITSLWASSTRLTTSCWGRRASPASSRTSSRLETSRPAGGVRSPAVEGLSALPERHSSTSSGSPSELRPRSPIVAPTPSRTVLAASRMASACWEAGNSPKPVTACLMRPSRRSGTAQTASSASRNIGSARTASSPEAWESPDACRSTQPATSTQGRASSQSTKDPSISASASTLPPSSALLIPLPELSRGSELGRPSTCGTGASGIGRGGGGGGGGDPRGDLFGAGRGGDGDPEEWRGGYGGSQNGMDPRMSPPGGGRGGYPPPSSRGGGGGGELRESGGYPGGPPPMPNYGGHYDKDPRDRGGGPCGAGPGGAGPGGCGGGGSGPQRSRGGPPQDGGWEEGGLGEVFQARGPPPRSFASEGYDESPQQPMRGGGGGRGGKGGPPPSVDEWGGGLDSMLPPRDRLAQHVAQPYAEASRAAALRQSTQSGPPMGSPQQAWDGVGDSPRQQQHRGGEASNDFGGGSGAFDDGMGPPRRDRGGGGGAPRREFDEPPRQSFEDPPGRGGGPKGGVRVDIGGMMDDCPLDFDDMPVGGGGGCGGGAAMAFDMGKQRRGPGGKGASGAAPRGRGGGGGLDWEGGMDGGKSASDGFGGGPPDNSFPERMPSRSQRAAAQPVDDCWAGQSLGDAMKKKEGADVTSTTASSAIGTRGSASGGSGGGGGGGRGAVASVECSKTPQEIIQWVQSLPESHVPQKAREQLSAIVSEGRLNGNAFSQYVQCVPPEVCAPKHAMKLKAAWGNVLKEAEARKVASENLANNAARPKATMIVV
mmetsp:Transcript_62368/g.203471  ORF Transcript_62368/g.203471 Transcript_62368/m.203471 type:complete len:806 (+) Transcript_62368:705-3122(+)